jgi:type IV secretion system protein VirD4
MKARILPPPTLSGGDVQSGSERPQTASQGDWSDAIVLTPTTAPVEDPANAGIRREPEPPEQEEIAPEPRKAVHEFEPMEDEPDDEPQRAIRRTMGSVARQVSLDPADDMGM